MINSQALHTHSPVEGERGVCAAGHHLSAAAGVRVMREGGNAFDALVAAAFTSFVVEPASCGIGGYGHISLWVAQQRRFVSVDAYCRAPLAARPDLFEVETGDSATYYGHPFTTGNLAMVGPLSAAVPGAVAGFCQVHRDFGRLPLAQVLEPAIEAARSGIEIKFSDRLGVLERAGSADLLPEAEAFLKPATLTDGYGDFDEHRFDLHALGKSLQSIANRGPDVFYRGRLGRAIARYVARHDGLLSGKDLSAYRTRTLLETPLVYRNLEYVSCFDQVAYEALNILDHFELRKYGPHSYEYRHLVAEALGIAFTDSMTHYRDPDYVDSPVAGLSHPGFAAGRRRQMKLRQALPRPIEPGDPWRFEASGPRAEVVTTTPSLARRDGTSQAATADAEGNMAATCMSIGSSFGSLVYVPEVGCFLNNAMQNFDPRPGLPNSIAPGKMPIFAAPALVATGKGQATFAGSGSGGYRIETGVLHAFMNVVDHRMRIQDAIDAPRVHCQGGTTAVEPRIPVAVRDRLARAGHHIVLAGEEPGGWPYGRVCAVTYDRRRKVLVGGAGPSWHSAIAAF